MSSPQPDTTTRRLLAGRSLAAVFAGGLLSLATPAGAREPAGDVLPFRILYGNPGKTRADETACYVWSEGGRLHVRITADRRARAVEGLLELGPRGAMKDVVVETPEVRIRQPLPSRLQFDLRTEGKPAEISVVLEGDLERLRVNLSIDGKKTPEALRIGERQERPTGLPADLTLTGARASWIERFGFY